MAFWWRNTSSPMWIKDKGGGGPFQAGRIVQEPEGACVFRYDKQNGQGRGGLGGSGNQETPGPEHRDIGETG